MFSGRQILKNTLLLTAAALLLRLVSMLLQAYLSARIGADGLGLVQLVLSVCAFSMTLGLAGARVAATCLCAQAHGRRSRAEVQSAVYHCLGYVLLTSCTVSAILFFAAPWLSAKLLQEPAAEAGLRLLAGMLPSACVNLVLGGYFTATGQVLRLTAVDIGERILCLGLTFLFLQVSGSDAAGACLALLSGDLLSGLLNIRLGYMLVGAAGIAQSDPAVKIKAPQLKKLASLIKGWRLDITGTKDFSAAQVTAGGVPLTELDPHTMASKKAAGFYLAGEMLNIHGDCGGYNLHFAWASGITAGKSAAYRCLKEEKR